MTDRACNAIYMEYHKIHKINAVKTIICFQIKSFYVDSDKLKLRKKKQHDFEPYLEKIKYYKQYANFK